MKDRQLNSISDDAKLIYKLIFDKGIHPDRNAVIALNYTEGESEGYITINHTSIDVKVNLKDISDENNLIADGIRVWRTWTWR